MNYIVILNKKVWCSVILLITVLALTVRYMFFTEKFFVDSLNLLIYQKFGAITSSFGTGSRGFTAEFFYYINFFNIDNLLEWSIYISIIFFFINVLFLKNIYELKFNKFLLIAIALLLWYLFAAGITKEVVQTLVYFSIYFIIYNDNFCKSPFVKVIVGVGIIYCSSLVFREYYALVALLTIFVYCINQFLKDKFNHINKYLLLLTIYILMIVVFLFIISNIMPEEYTKIMILKNEVYATKLEGNTDSFIGNVLYGDSLLIYMINYIINYFRMLIPLELLIVGKIYYIPFIIYQISFSYYYVKNIYNLQHIDEKKFLNIIFLTSYILVSVMMEPDFGSWVRHQTACYMFVVKLLQD